MPPARIPPECFYEGDCSLPDFDSIDFEGRNKNPQAELLRAVASKLILCSHVYFIQYFPLWCV